MNIECVKCCVKGIGARAREKTTAIRTLFNHTKRNIKESYEIAWYILKLTKYKKIQLCIKTSVSCNLTCNLILLHKKHNHPLINIM